MKRVKKHVCLLFLLLGILCLGGAAKVSAASENVVTTAVSVKGGTWIRYSGRRMYRYAKGTYARNIWLKMNGKVYHFNARGFCDTGWINYNNQTYYADANGAIYVNRWRVVGQNRCYFMANGACAKSRWLKIGGKYYYFAASGRMLRSTMFAVSGRYYYVNASGVRATSSWVRIKGKLYYFDRNGVRLQNQWITYHGKYYYLGANGAMATSQWIGQYYVTASGARLTDCVLGGYYLNEYGQKTVKVFKGKYILVGDSRMLRMSRVITDASTKFIALGGKGYKWLSETAGVELQYYLKANPNVKVVLALGVNDLGNIASYITYYRKLVADYPETEFYMLSVNPVVESITVNNAYPVTDAKIRAFNRRMYLAFPNSYLNCYAYLTLTGFDTEDGLHYTSDTSQRIYNYIVRMIG